MKRSNRCHLRLPTLAAQVFAARSIDHDRLRRWRRPRGRCLKGNCWPPTQRRPTGSRRSISTSAGYLLHTPRWGTLDGPDDAIETFYNWTLLHALGGSDSVLQNYKKALEGHYKQYGELRTKLTKLAENGAYYKEFVTQSDWFHTGEGMRGFMFLGFRIRTICSIRERMKRFAGMYMGEDPEAPNYDPKTKVITKHLDRQQGADAAQGDRVRLGRRSGSRQLPSAAQSRRAATSCST